MNNIVWIIMDSCRCDSWNIPRPVESWSNPSPPWMPNCSRLGSIEKRTAWSSWTPAAHVAYLHGMMPFTGEPAWVPGFYRDELTRQWSRRIGAKFDPTLLSPHMCLPRALASMGYECNAITSLPLLGRETIFAAEGFKRFLEIRQPDPKTMAFDDGLVTDIGAACESSSQPGASPQFFFINLAETHYPYMLPNLPVIHGLHGVAKGGQDQLCESCGGSGVEEWGTEYVPCRARCVNGLAMFGSSELDAMDKMHAGQRDAARRLDVQIGKLFSLCPRNTWFIVTADHGECFGEGGYFGHGPVWHEKVFEIPFVEGLNPSGGL